MDGKIRLKELSMLRILRYYKKLNYIPLLIILLIGVIFISGCVQQSTTTSGTGQEQTTQQKTTPETGKIIKAPDTGNVLFTLNGTEIIDGDCRTAESFSKYGVIFPKYCEGLDSTDISNYCELGNEKGENVNYHYCRPMRFMKCIIVSSSGDVEDVKYYGITKVLKCNNKKEQLIDIQVKSCTTDGFRFYCS